MRTRRSPGSTVDPVPESFDPLTVPVRPAATVMLLRDAPTGIEVFMLRRTTAAVFAGGMYVFPGGRVDPADGAGDEAFVVAAIRECYEEAGVLLADGPDGHSICDGHPALAHRHDVHAGILGLRELCHRHHLALATERLAWVSNWVTPIGESRRFDTRFFVAVTPPGQSSLHDDHETIESLWIAPAAALAHGSAGTMGLMPPTIESLTMLAAHDTAESVLAAARAAGTPVQLRPKRRFDETGEWTGLSFPGDPDYDELV